MRTRGRPANVYLVLFAAVVLSTSIGNAQDVRAIQVDACRMLKEPDLFNGHVVRTRLVIGYSFHSTLLFDPECEVKHGSIQPTFYPPYVVDSDNDKRLNKLLNREGALVVTVEGRFVSGSIFGSSGSFYKMEVHSITDIQTMTKAQRAEWNIGTGKQLH